MRCRAYLGICGDQPTGRGNRGYTNLAAHPRHTFFDYGLPSPESNQLVRVDLQNIYRPSIDDIMLHYSNVSEDDILLREKLEGYASSHSARFKIWNVLSSPNEAKQRTLDPKVCRTLATSTLLELTGMDRRTTAQVGSLWTSCTRLACSCGLLRQRTDSYHCFLGSNTLTLLSRRELSRRLYVVLSALWSRRPCQR